MATTQVQTNTLQLTPTAAKTVREMLAQRSLDNSYALRVYVTGRSCSGYQYGMALDNKPQAADSTFECEGIRMLVDEISIQYMLGSTIDFIDDERGKGFLVDNPNMVEACSCGGSGCGCEGSEN